MNNREVYDCICVGLGGHGSSAIARLAARGQKVLGLEKYGRTHTLGSSHGFTRNFRILYFEEPKYVPLLMRSRELFAELNEFNQSGCDPDLPKPPPLLRFIGSLQIDSVLSDKHYYERVVESAKECDVGYETYDANELRRKYPLLQVRDDERGILDTSGGGK